MRHTQLLELSKCRNKTYGLSTALIKGSLVEYTTKSFQGSKIT